MEPNPEKDIEYGLWKIKAGNQEFSLIGVYHPPPSEINVHTNQQFVNELLDFFTEIMNKCNDIIIAANFNIHYFSEIYADWKQLEDMIEAIGLKHHVRNETHKSGNIIDLVFTEQTGNIKIDEISTSDYVSDHASILWTILLEKPKSSVAMTPFGNWKSTEMNPFSQQLEWNGLDNTETDLPHFLLQFQNRIKKVIDEKVPMKTKKLTIRETQPWFNDEVRQQRRFVHRRESIWNKYKQEHH